MISVFNWRFFDAKENTLQRNSELPNETTPPNETQEYLWGSAVLLRTNIDAGSYKQYIFPLLFFKRLCDVYDEETAEFEAQYGEDADLFADDHSFIIPEGQHWRDVRQVTEDVGQAIVNAFRAIEKANGDKLTGIFGDGAWTNPGVIGIMSITCISPTRTLQSVGSTTWSRSTLRKAAKPRNTLRQTGILSNHGIV